MQWYSCNKLVSSKDWYTEKYYSILYLDHEDTVCLFEWLKGLYLEIISPIFSPNQTYEYILGPEQRIKII